MVCREMGTGSDCRVWKLEDTGPSPDAWQKVNGKWQKHVFHRQIKGLKFVRSFGFAGASLARYWQKVIEVETNEIEFLSLFGFGLLVYQRRRADGCRSKWKQNTFRNSLLLITISGRTNFHRVIFNAFNVQRQAKKVKFLLHGVG